MTREQFIEKYNNSKWHDPKEFISDLDSLFNLRTEDLVCPFCGEKDFDKVGLKIHLHEYCGEYMQLKAP